MCKRFRIAADDNELWDALLALATKETKHIHKFAEVSPVKIDLLGKYAVINTDLLMRSQQHVGSKHVKTAALAKGLKNNKKDKEKEKEKDNNAEQNDINKEDEKDSNDKPTREAASG